MAAKIKGPGSQQRLSLIHTFSLFTKVCCENF